VNSSCSICRIFFGSALAARIHSSVGCDVRTSEKSVAGVIPQIRQPQVDRKSVTNICVWSICSAVYTANNYKFNVQSFGVDQHSPNSTWLVTSRFDTTRHVGRVESMYFGCVELVERRGSTRSSRRARHVERVVSCQDVAWRTKWNLGL